MSRIAVGQIHYNAAAGAYEARVDIAKGGMTYRYPCSVPGTLSMQETVVRQNLARQARTLASRDGGLLSVR